MVELHGGSIEASSEGPGRGATFRVTLPVWSSRSVRDRRPARSSLDRPLAFTPAPELKGIKVLVVDDEADARELLLSVLEQCGARAVAVASAREGLARVLADRPDVILSDVRMPNEDGYSFIRSVRALPPHDGGRTPAAALSAYARAEDRRQALTAGFEMHIPKPIEPAELVAALATLVGIGKAMS